jgi:hypothetical protein
LASPQGQLQKRSCEFAVQKITQQPKKKINWKQTKSLLSFPGNAKKGFRNHWKSSQNPLSLSTALPPLLHAQLLHTTSCSSVFWAPPSSSATTIFPVQFSFQSFSRSLLSSTISLLWFAWSRQDLDSKNCWGENIDNHAVMVGVLSSYLLIIYLCQKTLCILIIFKILHIGKYRGTE